MTRLRIASRCAVAVALLGAARIALPADFAYDLERLWLDPSARGSLVIGSGETLPARGLRLTLAGGYERSPLVAAEDGLRGRGLLSEGDELADLVKDRWTIHVTAAAALTDRLELGLRLPMTASQESPDLSDLRSTLVGTPSAMLRLGLTRQGDGAPVSSAIAVEFAYPIHDDGDVDGDPDPFFVPRLEIGHRFARFLAAANLGAVIRPNALDLGGGQELGHEYSAGAVLATTGAPLRAELSLRAAVNGDDVGTHGELLGGLRWGLRNAELFALGGPGLLDAPGTPTFRVLVGLALFTAEPSAATAPAVARASPSVDPCAAGRTHTPAQCPTLDDDGDGIANAADRCPVEAGLAALAGCPVTDGDGDGIADAQDRCPSEPGAADAQGCPPPRAELGAGRIDLRERVYFDFGKAFVQQRSFPLLDEVARLLAANPQVGRVRVEGHTDDRGEAAANRRLSQARAEAVKAYLVEHGVDTARLEVRGFGPDQPAEPNTTAAGRDANRRVEFTILEVTPP